MDSLKLLFLLVVSASRISSQNVTVKTSVGDFVGFKKQVELLPNNFVFIKKFLGIPYAEPPVGILRFRNPRRKSPLAEPLRVHEFGSRCLESLSTNVGSEDCLYLNVYVPDRNVRMAPFAVMIYIHGGSFARGSGQDYDSDLLPAIGQTIIVTINYRLNVWGFLSTDDHNSYGNYGLRDQQLAIQWVHDNIEAFGGDNNRTTIFGESAGAASVIYQGLYPENEGLFQRIIAQSGSASAPWAISLNPKESAERLAQATGCNNDSVEVTTDCLRNLTTSAIRGAVDTLSYQGLANFGPTIDNMFVTCNPEDVLNVNLGQNVFKRARNMLASVDLIIGINSKEGAYGTIRSNPDTFMPNKTYFDDVLVPALVTSAYGNTLDNSTASALSSAISRKYTDAQGPQDPYRIREQYLAMHGDVNFLGPAQATVDVHASVSSKMTYMYYLSVNPPFHLLPTPSWVKGSSHADDLMFIFLPPQAPFNEQEHELARRIRSWWTNFAKTGNPNQPEDVGVTWEAYTQAKHYYLDLTTNMTSQNVKQGLHEDKSAFWNTEVPDIIGAETEVCHYSSSAPILFKYSFVAVSVLLLLLV